MSRYIDADAVYETLCHLWDRSDSEEFEKEVFNTILSAPSIDIVRCSECVHCADDYILTGVYCGISDVLMGANGFCSIGRRKEGE
jgi:hypothetical protein